LAALAATSAFAQSSVTLSGLVDAGYASQKTLGDTTSSVIQNASKTSTFKFTGTEDLGSGLKANFQFEVQPSYVAANGNATTSTGTPATAYANNAGQTQSAAAAQSGLVGKGQSFVGLSSATLGTVNFGTINLASLSAWANATGAFGTNIGSGYKTVGADTTRAENTVAYVTPTFAGFTASVAKATGMDAAYGTTSAINLRRAESNEIGLTYENGPFKAMYANLKTKTAPNGAANTTNITTTIDTMSAKYDAGFVRFGALHQKSKDDNIAANTITSNVYSIEAPVGAWTFTALTGKQKISDAGVEATAVEGDNKVKALQAKYDLSKRTYVYLMNESRTVGASTKWASVVVNGAALTGAPTDNKIKTTAIGLVHNF
jgi:predicted porin